MFWSAAAALAVLPTLAVLGQQGIPPRLATITGSLEQCDGAWCLGATVADFGPRWYLTLTAASTDFDGDGQAETLAQEVEGLIGAAVVLEVAVRAENADVYFVNGLQWRPLLGPPPWASGPLFPDPTPLAQAEDDPALNPEPVAQATPQAEVPDPTPSVTSTPVDAQDASALTSIEGELSRCGGEWCVGEAVVDFGPWWYLNETTTQHDFDADGVLETLGAELEGLLGETVVVEIELGHGDPDVYTLNGMPWRPPEGAPPWAEGPLGSPPGPPFDPPGPPPGLPPDQDPPSPPDPLPVAPPAQPPQTPVPPTP